MGDIIYEYEVSHDVVVSAIFVSESELREKINIFFIISYEGEKRGY